MIGKRSRSGQPLVRTATKSKSARISVGRFMSGWPKNVWRPTLVSTSAGIVRFKTCYVTQSPALAEAALEAQVPTLSPLSHGCRVLAKIGSDKTSKLWFIWTPSGRMIVRRSYSSKPFPNLARSWTILPMRKPWYALSEGLALRVADNTVSKPCVLEAGRTLARPRSNGLSELGRANEAPDRRGRQRGLVFWKRKRRSESASQPQHLAPAQVRRRRLRPAGPPPPRR